jgi:hypothetical protein
MQARLLAVAFDRDHKHHHHRLLACAFGVRRAAL